MPFALKFLTHERTEYIADIGDGKAEYRPYADACHWTAADGR